MNKPADPKKKDAKSAAANFIRNIIADDLLREMELPVHTH